MPAAEAKKRLEKQKEKLIEELAYYKKEDPFLLPSRERTAMTDDDLGEIESHDRITATRLKLKENLSLVEKALKRIEAGKYGLCSVCGRKIEGERLRIIPTATLCLEDEKKRR